MRPLLMCIAMVEMARRDASKDAAHAEIPDMILQKSEIDPHSVHPTLPFFYVYRITYTAVHRYIARLCPHVASCRCLGPLYHYPAACILSACMYGEFYVYSGPGRFLRVGLVRFHTSDRRSYRRRRTALVSAAHTAYRPAATGGTLKTRFCFGI